MRRDLLMADEDVPNPVRVVERVVQGEGRSARMAEDDLDPGPVKAFNERFRSGHPLRFSGGCRPGDGRRLARHNHTPPCALDPSLKTKPREVS
jgi:hypothetical protein